MRLLVSLSAFFTCFYAVTSSGMHNVAPGTGGDTDTPDTLIRRGTRIIELTQPIDNYTVAYPGLQRFKEEDESNGFGTAGNDLCTAEHAGTHLDAPYQFVKSGSTVGDIPLSSLILKLVVIDVRAMVGCDSDFVLRRNQIKSVLSRKLRNIRQNMLRTGNHGTPTSPDDSDNIDNLYGADRVLLLFRTGWSRHYRNPIKYLGGTETDNLHFPGISNDLAEWIVRQYRFVVGVGIDTASIDPGNSVTYDAHKTLQRANRYVIENVSFEEAQDADFKRCTAIAMVPRFTGGTGSTVRLVAVCR